MHCAPSYLIDKLLEEKNNRNKMQKQQITVLYHCQCPDGGFAAMCAYLRYHNKPNVELHFRPVYIYKPFDNIDTEPNIFTPQTIVYMLDTVGSPSVLVKICSRVKLVVLLDHHKTADEDIKKMITIPSNLEYNITMDNSAAMISWKYFSENIEMSSADKDRIFQMIRYIEDNDLWKKALPHTNEFSAAMKSNRYNFDFTENPKIFEQLKILDTNSIINTGKLLWNKTINLVKLECDKAFTVYLGGKEGSNTLYGKPLKCFASIVKEHIYRSDIGNELVNRVKKLINKGYIDYCSVGLVVYTNNDISKDQWKISLRSDDIDTTLLSTKYGGGGHKNASSFLINKKEFDTWRV